MFIKAANTLINMDKVEYIDTSRVYDEHDFGKGPTWSCITFYRNVDKDEILDSVSFDDCNRADEVFVELCEAIGNGLNLFIIGDYE